MRAQHMAWHGMAELQAVPPRFSESELQRILNIKGLLFGGSFEPVSPFGSVRVFPALKFCILMEGQSEKREILPELLFRQIR